MLIFTIASLKKHYNYQEYFSCSGKHKRIVFQKRRAVPEKVGATLGL